MALTARRARGKLPPGPKGHFLVGSLPEISRDWLGFLTRCAREYGDVVFFRLAHVPVCLLTHPDGIERVLVTEASKFVKSRDYRALAQVLGNGLLTSEGEAWRRQRKRIQPAFRHENILAYTSLMVERANRMLAGWRPGETRDVHQDMMRVTLEIIAEALFGFDVSPQAESISAALQTFTEKFINQASFAFLLPARLPVPGRWRLERAARNLSRIIYAMIQERRARPQATGDLLGTLLGMQSSEEGPMDDRQLRDELITLLLAGHETTAIALSWTFYLLAQHPAVEANLARELCEVLAGRLPEARDLPRLRYTEMVVKESMRLYPPAWGIGRETLEDFELDGYRLPAGTNIFLVQWITHRDPRFYEDPERFEPDRWRDDPIRSGRLPRFAYFPFGGGPRVCVGASFAMAEATLLLAAIAQRFHLALVPGHPVEIFPSITLRPKHGIRVVVQPQ
jgi:cytochrome P450